MDAARDVVGVEGSIDGHSHDHDHDHDASTGEGDATVDGASRDRSRDLEVRLVDYSEVSGRYAQFRLVSRDDVLAALAVLPSIGPNADRFSLPGAVVESGMRVDWWIDRDGDQRYSPPPADQAWRTLLPSAGPYMVDLRPSAETVDIATPVVSRGLDLVARMSGFEAHANFPLQATLQLTDTDRFVGFYRIAALPESGRVEFVLPGIVYAGQRYTLFWFIDLNRNGVYDRYGDHSASFTTVPNDAGLVIVHDHHENRTWQE